MHSKFQEISGTRLAQSPQLILLCDFSGSDIGTLGVLLANMLAAATMLIAGKWKSINGDAYN